MRDTECENGIMMMEEGEREKTEPPERREEILVVMIPSSFFLEISCVTPERGADLQHRPLVRPSDVSCYGPIAAKVWTMINAPFPRDCIAFSDVCSGNGTTAIRSQTCSFLIDHSHLKSAFYEKRSGGARSSISMSCGWIFTFQGLKNARLGIWIE